MPAAKPELKAECVRLRVKGRLSIREIHQQTGASKGSLSAWLQGYPLTGEERKARLRGRRPGGLPKKDRGQESALHRIARGKRFTSNEKAKVAESAALLRMVIHQLIPFGSPFDGDRADWLVDVPKKGIYRIQVKCVVDTTCTVLPVVSLRRSGSKKGGRKRYQKGDFDFIVGYDLYTDTCYVWSWDDVSHLMSTVTVCSEARERWDKLWL